MLADLAGRGSAAPPPAEGLARAAADAYGLRTIESVRRAAALWLEEARAHPDRIEGLTEATRARVWLSEHETDEEARRLAATEAVQAAQICAERASADPSCAYWLAVALGVQARERQSTALDALPRMVELLEHAVDLAPGMEQGGPDRVLALVRVRAPAWPTGPGDPERAIEHARAAVAIAPDHPPNRLCLAEVLEALDEREAAAEAYRLALGLAERERAGGDPEAEAWLAEAREGLERLGP